VIHWNNEMNPNAVHTFTSFEILIRSVKGIILADLWMRKKKVTVMTVGNLQGALINLCRYRAIFALFHE
jgi:hypothetical protein